MQSPPSAAQRADVRHPTGLRALTQSGEQFQAGVTVGRLHSGLLLERKDGLYRIAANASVDPVRLESLLI